MAALTLYIGNKNYSSWSLRPWVLMTHLGLAFDEVLVPFEGDRTRQNFLRFSPSGKVPCLIDRQGDDNAGIVVWDSLAITEYLAEAAPQVWPADRAARAWARSAAAEMHSGFTAIRNHCPMSCGIRVRLHEVPLLLSAEWERLDERWQEGLARFGGPFLAGREFTAVDAFYAPVAFRIQTYLPVLSSAAMDYSERMLALPAMQSWYAAGLAETWRDEAHDEEILALGECLKDLRAAAR